MKKVVTVIPYSIVVKCTYTLVITKSLVTNGYFKFEFINEYDSE